MSHSQFHKYKLLILRQVGGQAVLGRQDASPTPWLTERHGYDPTFGICACISSRITTGIHVVRYYQINYN